MFRRHGVPYQEFSQSARLAAHARALGCVVLGITQSPWAEIKQVYMNYTQRCSRDMQYPEFKHLNA